MVRSVNVKKTKKFKENRPENYHVHDIHVLKRAKPIIYIYINGRRAKPDLTLARNPEPAIRKRE